MDDDDKLFILFVFSLSCMFMAKTSIGGRGSPPPHVKKSRILPRPRNAAIAPTPAAAPPATMITLSIAMSWARNLPRSI